MTTPKYPRHKSEFRSAPLERSNPFTKPKRRAAFDESVSVLTKAFPHASPDWVRKNAWATARRAQTLSGGGK